MRYRRDPDFNERIDDLDLPEEVDIAAEVVMARSIAPPLQTPNGGRRGANNRTVRRRWTGEPRFFLPMNPSERASIDLHLDAVIFRGLIDLGILTGDFGIIEDGVARFIAAIHEQRDRLYALLHGRGVPKKDDIYLHELGLGLQAVLSIQEYCGALTLVELTRLPERALKEIPRVSKYERKKLIAAVEKAGLKFTTRKKTAASPKKSAQTLSAAD